MTKKNFTNWPKDYGNPKKVVKSKSKIAVPKPNSKEPKTWYDELEEKATLAPAGSAILDQCFVIATMLLDKNISYGNSALEPIRIFSAADSVEQLRVRIDDKLSRLAGGKEYPNDNDINDLIGYLILYKVALNEASF